MAEIGRSILAGDNLKDLRMFYRTIWTRKENKMNFVSFIIWQWLPSACHTMQIIKVKYFWTQFYPLILLPSELNKVMFDINATVKQVHPFVNHCYDTCLATNRFIEHLWAFSVIVQAHIIYTSDHIILCIIWGHFLPVMNCDVRAIFQNSRFIEFCVMPTAIFRSLIVSPTWIKTLVPLWISCVSFHF